MNSIKALPYVMFGINFIAFLAGLFFVTQILRMYGRNVGLALFYVILPGFLCRLLRPIPDVLAWSFVVASLYFYLRKKNMISAILIIIAMLTYEITVIIALALFLYFLFKRDFRKSLLFMMPLAVLFIWQWIIYLIFKCPSFAGYFSAASEGGIGGGLYVLVPFMGMAKNLSGLFYYKESSFFMMVCLYVAVIFAIAYTLKVLFKEGVNPITISLLCYALFAFVYSYYPGPWGFLRILNGLFIMVFLVFATSNLAGAPRL